MSAVVRPFQEEDWPAVEAVIAEVLAEGETYAMPVVTGAEARSFWFDGSEVVLVAEVEGQVVGTAKAGPNRPAQGSHIGTASFMVSAAARGHGVGLALGRAVVDWHRERGFRSIQFNAVVESNTAAVRLWQALGFEIVGTVPGAFRLPSGEYVGLHVMCLDLRRSAS